MILPAKIPYDSTGDNVIVISYPPGGLGNFVYYLLTEFANDTIKIDNSQFTFEPSGRSHRSKKYTNLYFHRPENYQPLIWSSCYDQVLEGKRILVLCDNELYDEYSELRTVFPKATVVRIVIDPEIHYIIHAMLHTKNHLSHNLNIEELQNQTFPDMQGKFDPIDQDRIVNFSLREMMLDCNATVCALIKKLNMQVIDTIRLESVVSEWYQLHNRYFIKLRKNAV